MLDPIRCRSKDIPSCRASTSLKGFLAAANWNFFPPFLNVWSRCFPLWNVSFSVETKWGRMFRASFCLCSTNDFEWRVKLWSVLWNIIMLSYCSSCFKSNWAVVTKTHKVVVLDYNLRPKWEKKLQQRRGRCDVHLHSLAVNFNVSFSIFRF